MTEQQINNAKQRAQDVVDGLKTAKTYNAHDALKLATTLQQRNKQLAALQAENEELKRKNDASDLFGGIFK